MPSPAPRKALEPSWGARLAGVGADVLLLEPALVGDLAWRMGLRSFDLSLTSPGKAPPAFVGEQWGDRLVQATLQPRQPGINPAPVHMHGLLKLAFGLDSNRPCCSRHKLGESSGKGTHVLKLHAVAQCTQTLPGVPNFLRVLEKNRPKNQNKGARCLSGLPVFCS